MSRYRKLQRWAERDKIIPYSTVLFPKRNSYRLITHTRGGKVRQTAGGERSCAASQPLAQGEWLLRKDLD